MGTFFSELKRRKVMRVAAVYAITAWLLTQIVVVIEAPLHLPPWVDTLVIVLLILGFPVAMILAWAFDLTPQGVVRTLPTASEESAPSKSRRVGYAALAVVTVALGWFLYEVEFAQEGPGGPTSAASAAIDVSQPVPGFSGRSAIAVMPFLNLSGDPAQEYFADGISEDITTGLQSFGSFPVIARTSTFSYKDNPKDVREIAAELGAGYVLEGSVRKAGDQVRITAQLIAADGSHLWAKKYDRGLSDILAVQDEITQQIVVAIEPEIITSEIERTRYVRTEDLEAWDYYLQALANTTVFLGFTDVNGGIVTRERNEAARAYAQKAIELDPKFADAYTMLAHIDGEYIRTLRPQVSDEFAAQAVARAIGNAQRARGISPFGASACSCHAVLLLASEDVAGALQLQEEALKVNPASATVHSTLAKILVHVGQLDRALSEIELAKRLSPMDMTMTTLLLFESEIFEALGQFEKAAEVARRATLFSSVNYEAHVVRITSLFALGRLEEARAAKAALFENVPDFSPDAMWLAQPSAPLASALSLSMGEAALSVTRRDATAFILRALDASN